MYHEVLRMGPESRPAWGKNGKSGKSDSSWPSGKKGSRVSCKEKGGSSEAGATGRLEKSRPRGSAQGAVEERRVAARISSAGSRFLS